MTDSLIFSLIYFSFPSFCFFVLHFGRFLSNLKYLSSRSSISVISFSYRTVNIQSPIFIPWISLLTSFYSCFMNGLFSLFSLKISIMDSWKFIFLTCFWFLWSPFFCLFGTCLSHCRLLSNDPWMFIHIWELGSKSWLEDLNTWTGACLSSGRLNRESLVSLNKPPILVSVHLFQFCFFKETSSSILPGVICLDSWILRTF